MLALVSAACDGAQEQTEAPATTSALTESATQRSLGIPAGKVLAPGGRLINSECAFEVPAGATVNEAGDVLLNDKVIDHHAPCTPEQMGLAADKKTPLLPPTISHAWLDDTWANATTISGQTMYSGMDSFWYVPAAPIQNGALLYIFSSFVNVANQEIIQPVLQWGSNGQFGGNYWTIATWYCSPAHCPHSPGLGGIHSGDEIWGAMNIATPTSYKLEIEDLNTHTYSTGTPTVIGPMNTVQGGVLEVYNVTTCNNFPPQSAGIDFFDIDVYEAGPAYNTKNLVVPNWMTQIDTATNPSPNCGYTSTFSVSGTESGASLYF
jgi:hypothetical protein